MTITSITLQAADEAAMLSLLTQSGLIVLSEGRPVASPGVQYSQIGRANLASGPDNGTLLGGVYCLVTIDPDAFTAGDAAATISALKANNEYPGAPLRMFFGVPFAPDDINAKIDLLCLRKRNKAGFKTTGTKWYPFVDLVNNDMIGTYAAWVALGAGITAANVKVKQMDGSQQAVDQASALAILTSAVMTADAWRTKAKQAKAGYLANPATFDLRNINWPAGYAG